MAKVIILGSSNSVPTLTNENTHMVVVGEERVLLIDSVGSTVVRLEQAGVDVNRLTDVIITHFHPDHASGLPLLLLDLWLTGRKNPLTIYGLDYTLDRVKGVMDFYNWTDWENFFPVVFKSLAEREMELVLDCPDFVVRSSPVHHMIPTVGLRVEFPNQKTLAYSCDTIPCEEVVRLGAGADVLIHEATGEMPGHSSAAQAGEIATQAEAGKLYLIHYHSGKFQEGDLVAEASQTFQGEVELATDFMQLEF
ncbi:MAG: MBL fold metallo-hydrolase [Anaerolineales bacterium]|nr:MBL fold metallo-hydrolase [Anaerolineales bacterium]